MATLRYSQVRAHAGGTIHYIANKDKIVSDRAHDVYNVLNYMGSPESTERVYAFGRHCSANPDLAEKQIELHRQRYYASKKGGVQGLPADGAELLGLHFFMSYSEDDNPSEEVMNDISAKLVEHPLLRDFATFGANHYDKTHKHTHIFASQFSAEGKPRKMAMKTKDYNDLRRYANKLCVEHGLSIIDLSALRWKNPEYSDWIDRVIAEGKVVVHPEKEEHKQKPRQKVKTRSIYYKWMKEQEEAEARCERLMTDRQRKKKNFEKKYFFTPDDDENKRWYMSGDPQHRFYVVSIFSDDGYRRSKLELTVRLLLFVARSEGQYIKREDPATWLLYNAKVDTKLQNMFDYISPASKVNVTDPSQIAGRLSDCGKQMNALKREKSRHENSIAKQEKIIEAYEAYVNIKPYVEGVASPAPIDVELYKSAYAILAQNQVLTDAAYEEVRRRCEFEKRKIIDYEKRMPELKRQYHDLKRLEAVASAPIQFVNEIYGYTDRAVAARLSRERRSSGLVDDLITDAKSRTTDSGFESREKELS